MESVLVMESVQCMNVDTCVCVYCSEVTFQFLIGESLLFGKFPSPECKGIVLNGSICFVGGPCASLSHGFYCGREQISIFSAGKDIVFSGKVWFLCFVSKRMWSNNIYLLFPWKWNTQIPWSWKEIACCITAMLNDKLWELHCIPNWG